MALDDQQLQLIDAHWRAANYLSVGQIYLLDNPLLREPLRIEHVKPRLLGHWGTTPGLTFLYTHMNRVIREHGVQALFVTGPGHGGPGLVAETYLEGTYSETYPHIGFDEEGMRRLFRQFSFPGGVPSHVAPETRGSIHEGGELGYALVHAYGAVFDNPDLIACCVVGDGEAETGPLAASWHSHRFLDPRRDGASCRSSTSTATRSPTRRCWRACRARSCWGRSSRDTGTSRTSSRGPSRRRCTSSWQRRSTPATTTSGRFQQAAREGRRTTGCAGR
jgi:phosphoketolase